jgi:hypothetical protein
MFEETVPGNRWAVCMTMPTRPPQVLQGNGAVTFGFQQNCARRGFVEPVEQPQKRRLSRSAWPDDRENLTCEDLYADVIDNASSSHLSRQMPGLECHARLTSDPYLRTRKRRATASDLPSLVCRQKE